MLRWGQPTNPASKDAGLCHGAAGLAHLFNRMHQATGDLQLADAARDWFRRTLAMRHPGRGIGGFESWRPDKARSGTWTPDPDFLTGSVGIALALLAATAQVEPTWDAVLLASIPRSAASPKIQ